MTLCRGPTRFMVLTNTADVTLQCYDACTPGPLFGCIQLSLITFGFTLVVETYNGKCVQSKLSSSAIIKLDLDLDCNEVAVRITQGQRSAHSSMKHKHKIPHSDMK